MRALVAHVREDLRKSYCDYYTIFIKKFNFEKLLEASSAFANPDKIS